MYVLVESNSAKPKKKKKYWSKLFLIQKEKNGMITFQGKIIWVLPSEVNCYMQLRNASEKTD